MDQWRKTSKNTLSIDTFNRTGTNPSASGRPTMRPGRGHIPSPEGVAGDGQHVERGAGSFSRDWGALKAAFAQN